jgi:glucosamine--fructose-6-phosphate aminotransferase (isomerizing)
MDARGKHTLAEIMSQPAIWADALEVISARTADLAQFWQGGDFDQVIFTGCGSTYYLAQFSATLLQTQSGHPARAYPASELALFPDSCFNPNANTLLIAVSRSGETTETIGALRMFRQRYQGKTLVVTNYSESALAKDADFVLAIDSAREVSVAQTRSFSSMALVTQAIAGIFAGQVVDFSALPGMVARLLSEYEPLARALAEDPQIQRFFFLGSNALYAIGCEAMLKMKEMSLSYSEAYHMLEFRHGPMSMTNEQTLVVGLLSDQYGHELAVLRDMAGRGARVLAIGEEPDAQAASIGQVVALRTGGLPLWARAIAYLPFLQLMAYYRAMFNQQNPDLPGNLHAVIVLDPLV